MNKRSFLAKKDNSCVQFWSVYQQTSALEPTLSSDCETKSCFTANLVIERHKDILKANLKRTLHHQQPTLPEILFSAKSTLA